MTETITPAEVFKSREKFSKAMENSSNNTFIASILDDYPIKTGKVVMTITDLTQNYETFGNLSRTIWFAIYLNHRILFGLLLMKKKVF